MSIAKIVQAKLAKAILNRTVGNSPLMGPVKALGPSVMATVVEIAADTPEGEATRKMIRDGNKNTLAIGLSTLVVARSAVGQNVATWDEVDWDAAHGIPGIGGSKLTSILNEMSGPILGEKPPNVQLMEFLMNEERAVDIMMSLGDKPSNSAPSPKSPSTRRSGRVGNLI